MPQTNLAHAPQLLSLRSRALELQLLSPGLQLLRPVYLRPVLHNKRSHRNEKSIQYNEEQPLLTATRESPCKAMKTQYSQKCIIVFKKADLWQTDRETVERVSDFIFGGAPKSLQMVTAAMKLKDDYSLEGKL